MNNLVFNPAQLNGYNTMIPPASLASKTAEPVKVNGAEGARAYQMMPNSRVVLFDANEPIFYLRETDGSNNPLSFKTYRYEEVIEKPKVEMQYVTLDEFNKFKEELLNGKYIWNSTANGTGATSVSTELGADPTIDVGFKSESVTAGNVTGSSAKKSAV